MPKKRFTEDSWRDSPSFRALCSALLTCSTEDEMANLLRDVGTLSEIYAWSERLEVAKQLAQGKTYREVARNTGASTTTVTRVAKFIEDGPGGYRKFLKLQKRHQPMAMSDVLWKRMQQQREKNMLAKVQKKRQEPSQVQEDSLLRKHMESDTN